MSDIKRMTEYDITKYLELNGIAERESVTWYAVVNFARHCGILKKKLKKWRWWWVDINGNRGVSVLLTEQEAYKQYYSTLHDFLYGKCEGTEVECDE